MTIIMPCSNGKQPHKFNIALKNKKAMNKPVM